MRWRSSPVVILLLASSLSLAQASYRLKARTASEYAAEQRIAVSKYCRLDFEGSLLTEQGWQRIKPLVFNDRYPEFNVVEIVSRYQVMPAEGTSPVVNVSYVVLGRYQNGYGYTPSADNRVVTFRVEDKKGEIVITDIDENIPRVSKKVAVQWLKEQLAKSQNPIERTQIEGSLKVLDPPPAVSASAPGTTPAGEAK
jgi:hypothetical protein